MYKEEATDKMNLNIIDLIVHIARMLHANCYYKYASLDGRKWINKQTCKY